MTTDSLAPIDRIELGPDALDVAVEFLAYFMELAKASKAYTFFVDSRELKTRFGSQYVTYFRYWQQRAVLDYNLGRKYYYFTPGKHEGQGQLYVVTNAYKAYRTLGLNRADARAEAKSHTLSQFGMRRAANYRYAAEHGNLLEVMRAAHQKDFLRDVSNHDYRVHSGFTCLPKVWREKVTVDGESLVGIDAVNSHSVALAKLPIVYTSPEFDAAALNGRSYEAILDEIRVDMTRDQLKPHYSSVLMSRDEHALAFGERVHVTSAFARAFGMRCYASVRQLASQPLLDLAGNVMTYQRGAKQVPVHSMHAFTTIFEMAQWGEVEARLAEAGIFVLVVHDCAFVKASQVETVSNVIRSVLFGTTKNESNLLLQKSLVGIQSVHDVVRSSIITDLPFHDLLFPASPEAPVPSMARVALLPSPVPVPSPSILFADDDAAEDLAVDTEALNDRYWESVEVEYDPPPDMEHLIASVA